MADNSGAKEVLCIRVLEVQKEDMQASVTCGSVQLRTALPAGNIKKGAVSRAVVVRTKKK